MFDCNKAKILGSDEILSQFLLCKRISSTELSQYFFTQSSQERGYLPHRRTNT
nr:MAG TPA: hypothetical protein [Bacteriophage sp.]